MNERLQPYHNAALTLVARLQPVLEDFRAAVITRDGERLVARFDMSHVAKSADGVLEEMVRGWTGEAVALDFESFRERMTDLGRFRIVTNFLSDAHDLRQTLERAFAAEPASLSGALRQLCAEFRLEEHCLKGSFELPPGTRQKGERCHKGVFATRTTPSLKVEVQLVTILGEAWDKKDHFLIYEPRRRGVPLSPEHQNAMFGMSELLYLADKTFDDLRRAIRSDDDRAAEGRGHAPAE